LLFRKGLIKVFVAVSLIGLLAGLTVPFAVASDGSWTKERMTFSFGDSWLVDAEVDTNHVIHMVWWDNRPGRYEVYYNYRDQYGGRGTPFRVSDGGALDPPRIAVGPDGDILIVWTEDRGDVYGKSIYYRWRQSDTGWQPVERYPVASGNPSLPDVAINSQNVASIAWYSIVGEGPITWVYVDGVQVGGGYLTAAMCPRIVFDPNDGLHLVYQALDFSTEIGEYYGWKVMYTRRTSAGQWWQFPMHIAGGGRGPDAEHAFFPDVAVGPNNYGYILYRQEGPPIAPSPTTTNELYLCIAEEFEKIQVDYYGTGWANAIVCPSVKVSSSGNVYMTWSKDIGTGVFSVFYREIVDGIMYDTQRPLNEINIQNPIIVLDEARGSPDRGYIIYEDYSLGGDQGEIYMIYRDLPVIPEFSPSFVLTFLMLSTLSVAILARAKKNPHS